MIGETTYLATARFENGEVSVKVTAVTPYGNRSVSTTEELADKKVKAAVAGALKDAIDSASEGLRQKSFGEAARAVTAAFDNKESIEGPRTVMRLGKDGEAKAVKMKEEGNDA